MARTRWDAMPGAADRHQALRPAREGLKKAAARRRGERLEDRIRVLLDHATPLTDGQRARLATLLLTYEPAGEGQAAGAKA